ncbi:dienelactone hydrolase family protein [Hyphomonas sp.]|uniref:dienelactone hydrolase family protein n=1 Tax=Hyphomonas sp. TaxID=87 RepID=UPI0032ED769F
MTVTSLTLTSRDGFEFGAVRAEPAGARKGGLILVQEIFGINSFMLDAARRFAAEGYEVLVPSMFDRQKPGFAREDHSAEAIAEGGGHARANGLDAAMSDIGACIDALERPVYITGFCYGGSIAYLVACRLSGIMAASAYYGSLLPTFKAEVPKCPVIAHFGRLDAHIPMEGVEAFRTARHDVSVYVYEAGHGFARQRSDDHDATSDALAFKRTLDLFSDAVR